MAKDKDLSETEVAAAAQSPAAAEVLLTKIVERTLQKAKKAVAEGAPAGTAKEERLAEIGALIAIITSGKKGKKEIDDYLYSKELKHLINPKMATRISEQAEILWRSIKTGWSKVFGKEGYIRGANGTNARLARWCGDLAQDFRAFHARNREAHYTRMDAIGDAFDKTKASLEIGRIERTAGKRHFLGRIADTLMWKGKDSKQVAAYAAARSVRDGLIESRKTSRKEEVARNRDASISTRHTSANARRESSALARRTRAERGRTH